MKIEMINIDYKNYKKVEYPDYLTLLNNRYFIADAIPVYDEEEILSHYLISPDLDDKLESSWWGD